MCLLSFIRISAATLRGRQTKSFNVTEKLKAEKLKLSRRVITFFYYFAPLGFGIAEYKDKPIIEKKKKKKKKKNGGVCPGKWTQIPKN